MKKLIGIFVLMFALIAPMTLVATTGTASAATCVQLLYSPETHSWQMTSFSINTGILAVYIWNRPFLKVYQFGNIYGLGNVVIGWVPEWEVQYGIQYNQSGSDLVIVPQSNVGGAFGC